MHPAQALRPADSDSAYERLALWLAAHRRAVGVGFLLVAVASGIYGAPVASKLRSVGLESPGSESTRAADLLYERLGFGQPDVVAVFHATEGNVRDPLFASDVLDMLEGLLEDEGVATALSHYDTGLESLVSRDGTRTVVMVDLHGSAAEGIATLERIEPLLREVDAVVEIGGLLPAELLGQEISERDIARAEKVALPIAALLTLIFFRSVVAALLPLVIGIFSLSAAAALIRLVASFSDVSVFALTVSSFIGLGLSLDYSLLIVQRFREELARRGSIERAMANTLNTAGRAVWVSALTVAVSMAVLLVPPVPLLRGVGLGGVLAVGTACLGALVLLPVILAWLGPRVDLLAVSRPQVEESPFWRRVAQLSMRHPWALGGACVALLVTLALPGLRMESTIPDARSFPADSGVRRVEEQLADPQQFDQAGTWGIQVVVQADGPVIEPTQLRRVRAFLADVQGLPGAAESKTPLSELDPDTMSPAQLDAKRLETALDLQLSRTVDGDLAVIAVPPGDSWRSAEAFARVKAIRALPHPGLRVSVGGPTAQQLDIRETISQWAGGVVALVLAWNLLVLLRGFRSVLVPLKAAAMNVLALGASYGFLVWAFQDANLAGLLGFEPPGGIDPAIPVVMFAVVFGLSMDYEVFLLSRIREEFDKHGDNERSIVSGLAHTGRIITSAAAILIVVIGAFASGSFIYVKEVGLGIAFAIFLDVTVVRALLVPATMRLLGSWNWWAPSWLGGLGRLAPGDERRRA